MSNLKKAFALSLVVATVFGTFGSASAVSISDLLAQIAALQTQLAALQASSGTGSSAACLSKDLSYPMKDDQVKTVQSWLNVSPVSGYFGPLTKAAVVAYQKANSISPAAGYVGPLTRSSLNGKYCTTTPSTTPGTTPAPAGSVSVALSSSTPAAATLISGSGTIGSQSLAPVLTVSVTAPAASAVQVNQVTVHRSGVSADSDVANMQLFVNGMLVATSPSVSAGAFTFTNSAGLFTVAAGSTSNLTVKLDMAQAVTAGKTFQFGFLAASDFSTNATTVSGTFPVMGNSFTVAQVSDLGTMTLSNATPASNTAVDPGTTNYQVFSMSAAAGNQPQQVSYAKFTMVGTADYTALTNLQLFVDGVQVGSTQASMNSDKTVAFDMTSAPMAFTAGQTHVVSLRATVTAGAGRNFYFEVAHASDWVAMDKTYGVYVRANQANVFNIFAAAGTTSINQGSVTVNQSANAPTGPLTANSTNVKIASFDVKANGENIQLSQLTFTSLSTHTLNNVYVQINGSQYGSKVSTLAASTAQNFSGTYTLPAGVTQTVAVFADLTSPTVSGDTVQMQFNAGATNGVRMTSGSSVAVPGSSMNANAIAIAAGAVTAVKNASLANVNAVLNATNVVIGSWLITAPTDQGVSVTGITVNDNGASGLGSAFSNLALYSGSTQYGQTIASPSSTTGTSQTFNFGTAMAIAAGQSVQLDLHANVLSSASTTVWAGAGNTSVIIVTGTGVTATGATTNSAVTYSSGNVAAQTITLATGATLTMSTEATPTMPNSTYLVAGTTGTTLAAFRFAANNTEAVKVTQLTINETGAGSTPGNLQNLQLWVNGAQVGSAVPAFVAGASNTAVFANAAGLFTVPQNGYTTVFVKADATNKANGTFADAGKAQQISLYVKNMTSTATTNVVALGATSSQYATLAGGTTGGTYLSSNAMTYVKTAPTFAYKAPASTVLTPGTMEVLRFDITAASDADLAFLNAASNIIRMTVLSGKAGATGTVTLYDAATNTVLASSTGASLASGATVSFNFGTANTTIPAGTTKEYYVTADLTQFATSGTTHYSFQPALNNAAADLSFNDSSTGTANISAANYVGIGLPINGAVFVSQ